MSFRLQIPHNVGICEETTPHNETGYGKALMAVNKVVSHLHCQLHRFSGSRRLVRPVDWAQSIVEPRPSRSTQSDALTCSRAILFCLARWKLGCSALPRPPYAHHSSPYHSACSSLLMQVAASEQLQPLSTAQETPTSCHDPTPARSSVQSSIPQSAAVMDQCMACS